MKLKHQDRVFYRLRTHLEMLNDRKRCLAYQKAVESVVREKIVLDVGCGTGILSFFAARAGARLVLAVDMDVPPGAEVVANTNGLVDRVQFFRGKLQDIELPVDSVDVIVSEWMGGVLLMEDMLPVVLYARDRWLKPGGILLPDRARLFLAPLDDVAGISSKHFSTLRDTISSQMWVSVIDPTRFLAEPSCILELDLNNVQELDVKSYETGFCFNLNETGTLNGFGLWFDVLFNQTKPPVTLSTAPWLPPTHWAQALWILPTDIDVCQGDEVSGTFSQTKISPSTASFSAHVCVKSNSLEKISFDKAIEASPSNMNTTGVDENHISEQAMSGAYRGLECLWIGCSMSFAALLAARSGAKSVSVLNHSPWAALAMQQLASQQGLTNVRFLPGIPRLEQLENKDICLLGRADSSWQALLSHIKVRRALKQASFMVRFSREESPWQQFYGFDFTAYAPYDLEMYHEDKPSTGGLALNDITGQATSSTSFGPKQHKEEIIYIGLCMGSPTSPLNLPDGAYNCARINFNCGTVVLPLPETLRINSSTSHQFQKFELTISLLNASICRFKITLTSSGQSLQQHYEQPISSMGHIVRI
jgi:protein arginine N-methyltransferase 1